MGRMQPLAAGSTDSRDRADDVPTSTALLEACATPQRRRVVETLCEAGSLTLDTLAERIVARRRDVSPADVREDEREHATVGLYHNQLQWLSQAGIVDQSDDGDQTTVSLSPVVEPDRVRALREFGEEDWTALEAILSDERCQYVTTVLSTADGSLSLDELAAAVAVLERGEPERTNGEFLESVRISLHHVHLPKLAEADVVGYDADAHVVVSDRLSDAYDSVVSDDREEVHA